jgi:hypothetical protein
LAFALAGTFAMHPVRAASDVFVLQDGTPLVSKPGVGGKILLWVDTGFPLTVVGREGDWFEVSGTRLETGSDTLWVPAACRPSSAGDARHRLFGASHSLHRRGPLSSGGHRHQRSAFAPTAASSSRATTTSSTWSTKRRSK